MVCRLRRQSQAILPHFGAERRRRKDVEMKHPTAMALLVAVLVMAFANWTEADTDKAAIAQTMNDYFAAFADLGPTFDMRRALSFFHEPSMLITATRASSY